MKRIIKFMLASLLIFFAVITTSNVFADVPPPPPPGRGMALVVTSLPVAVHLLKKG